MDDIKAKFEHLQMRYFEKIERMNQTHLGKESNFTYWGGFDMGYCKGKLSVIEDVLDMLDGKIIEEFKTERPVPSIKDGQRPSASIYTNC